ncbi:MAG: hypothetical protein JWM11_5023 [Planctomycetaceae bacterium]|nr:hypothetical protein [Planctomycetaceae bacterium]
MLHGRLADGLKEAVPEWDVSFNRARFDFQGQVRVYEFALNSPETGEPILAVPETILSVDREQLGQQRLVCQQVRMMQPQLELHRNIDGTWNWESLFPIPAQQSSPPEWVIERGTLRLTIDRSDNDEPLSVILQNVHLQLTPSGKRRYVLSGTVLAGACGEIRLDGHWNMDDKTWKIEGHVDQFHFRTEVWDQICEFFPQCRDRVADFPRQSGFPLAGEPVTDPGLDAVGDLNFVVQQAQASDAIDYRCLINLKSGQWSHPLCPYPLDDVQAKIYCDSKQISVPNFSARHGTLQVLIRKGLWDISQPDSPITGLVAFLNLPLEPPTRSRLSPYLQEVYDQVQPAGKVDLKMQVAYTRRSGFRCDCDVIPKGCSAAHRKFPYPVDDIRGLIMKRGQLVDIRLKGLAAGLRELKLTGEIHQGPNRPSSSIEVQVDSVPLDETFVSAAPEQAQHVLKSLNLKGLANIHYQLSRRGGIEAPWETQLWSSVRQASMSCKCFPLFISDLQGIVEFDGQDWTFSKLKGSHGSAELTAAGDYRTVRGRGLLGLTVQTSGAEFNRELEAALPETWKKLFEEFSPKGKFDCETTIDWMPGQSPEIGMEADLKKVELSLKSFPLPLSEVRGHISLHRDPQDQSLLRADLTNIEGKHEDTKVAMKYGFAILEPTGAWRVRLDDLQVEDLNPNNRFRRALPTGFREVVDTLDPRDGPISLGGMLEFRGSGKPEDGATSAWDLEILCTDTSVTTGVDLKHLYGKFKIRGTWDGRAIATEGESDLTSMSIMGYQFSNVKGPISIYGNQLVIGSRDVVNPRRAKGAAEQKPPAQERITGRAIGGMFTLDGIAVLGKETSYKVVLTMRDALLERYAEQYMPHQHDLRGIMTGEAELLGRGSSARSLEGSGQLLIRPAALYQLPVMLAIIKQLNGGSPNNTAFEEAQAFFDISNGRFNFRQVDLKGAALNLKGFGWVSFDRRLSFDFFSSVSRNRAPLAVIQQMVGQATVGWMGVIVRGTLDNPDAKIRPAQRLDDAVKRFLGGIDPRSPTGQRGPARVEGQPGATSPRTPSVNRDVKDITRRP